MLASGSGYVPEGHIQIAGAGDQAEAMAASLPLIRCGLLCNDASLRTVGGEWRVEGDPLEGALFALAMKGAVDPELERSEGERDRKSVVEGKGVAGRGERRERRR